MIKRTSQGTLLPPPAGTILLYAADGLSSWKGRLGPTDRPRMPQRQLWVPMFRELVDSDEGLQTLHALAEAGMRAWHCPPTVIGCLEAALRDITFRALSIAALQHFAETAQEKVNLRGPESPSHRPRIPKPRAKPEHPSVNKHPNSPQRPNAHFRGSGPTP